MPVSKTTILTVDDDPYLARLAREILEVEGYAVDTAESGSEAIQALSDGQDRFSLILLDLNMPGLDGFTTCERIRKFSNVPIIVVTGRESESDKVRGLELGADDYVVKPFSPPELVARVRAVLRRAGTWHEADAPTANFQTGDLTIDFARSEVTVEDETIPLSATEYRLLAYLARNAGRILTPDQILQHVWGDEYLGESHLLRVTMGRLRQRLGDDAKNPRFIATRPGLGYSMVKSGA